MKMPLCLGVAVMLLAVGNVQADTVEVVSDRDSGLYQGAGAGDTQRGAGGRMDVGGTGGPAGTATDSSLLSFDLSRCRTCRTRNCLCQS